MSTLLETTEAQPQVQPPNGMSSWKSAFAQRVASKKISEEFEYFARIYDKLTKDGWSPTDAVVYGLEHASAAGEASDLLDDEKQMDKLPKGSKVCIVGAGMAGTYLFNDSFLYYKSIVNIVAVALQNVFQVGYEHIHDAG